MSVKSAVLTLVYAVLGIMVLILGISAFKKGGIFSRADQVYGQEIKVTQQLPEKIELSSGVGENIFVEIEGPQSDKNWANNAQLVEVDENGDLQTNSNFVFGGQTSSGVIKNGITRRRLALPISAKEGLATGSYQLFLKVNLGGENLVMATLFDVDKNPIDKISFEVEMK